MVTQQSDLQESGPLEKARKAALYFTMAVAVLTAVAEFARQRAENPSSGLDATANALDVLLMAGGVLMGLLFLLHLYRKRRSA